MVPRVPAAAFSSKEAGTMTQRRVLVNPPGTAGGAYVRPPGTVDWDAIRTPTHKWVEHTNGSRALCEHEPPFELQTVASNPTNASVIATLRNQLAAVRP